MDLRQPRRRGFPGGPEEFPRQRQLERFAPKFDRLAEVLARDPNGMVLRADPAALAPERLLVFELRASLVSFLAAIRNVPGLELVDEEVMEADEEDESPVAYLLVPDALALKQIESLWRRWQQNEPLGDAYMAGWRDAFALLKDVRPWAPQDRVSVSDAFGLEQDIEGLEDFELLRIEVELVFRGHTDDAENLEENFRTEVVRRGGRVIAQSRIEEIRYHALLVELPVSEVRGVLARSAESIAGIDAVMHIRPQSLAAGVGLGDPTPLGAVPESGELGSPILALLDGVPMAQHPLLARHLIVEDLFELVDGSQVSGRRHGTAMASLIVHGDRNNDPVPLPRKIHVIPVMSASGETEVFPPDRLVVDTIYNAVRAMRDTVQPTAPEVLVVNISLGNKRQQFHGKLSAWARLLDRLAYQYGILFLVSAGNIVDDFRITMFHNSVEFEMADGRVRSESVLSAVNEALGRRRIIAPAESINAVAVGACNEDFVSAPLRSTARTTVDPYPDLRIANPSSALGPGYAGAVKPDVLMPGARERLRVVRSDGVAISVVPAPATHSAGLKVAAPSRIGQENYESYINGTSAAAAMASRTCHRIHDALERAYGDDFLRLSHRERAVLLKALLAHTAEWPEATTELMKRVLGPSDGRQHVKQKDNVRRYLGYGLVDADAAVGCVSDRATFWAVGEVRSNQMVHVPIPIPAIMGGRAQPHTISVTLGWFSPTHAGTKAYRSIRLKLLEPRDLTALGLSASSQQPDSNQSSRGTLFSRRWEGSQAAVVSDEMVLRLDVQREPDSVGFYDDAIPFGLAVTISMPGVVEIYEQVRQRLGIQPRVFTGRDFTS